MNDLQVVNAKAYLTVTSAALVRGSVPPTLLVTGTGFDRADEVHYNNITTSFQVLSPTSMLVRVPSQIGTPTAVPDIDVLASMVLGRDSTVLQFKFPSPLASVSGLQRLVQLWVTMFMTTPGSSIFSSTGGGGQKLVGTLTNTDGDSAKSNVAIAVQNTNQAVLAEQAGIPGLPASERLLSASLLSVSFDQQSSTVTAKVQLLTMTGLQALVSLG